MAASEGTFGSAVKTVSNIISILIGLAAIGAIGFIVWPSIKDKPLKDIIILETADVAHPTVRPFATPIPNTGDSGAGAPAAVPTMSNVQIEATSQAIYQATVIAVENAAQPPANTGQGAPAQLVVKPAERLPAGDNVPTAEPMPQVNESFGSKQVIVAPQETHTCKHGQVWTDKGCKNP